MFANSAEAKKAGWYSRRHETRESHAAAVEAAAERKAAQRGATRQQFSVPQKTWHRVLPEQWTAAPDRFAKEHGE